MNFSSQSIALSRFMNPLSRFVPSSPLAGLRGARLGDATIDEINSWLNLADPLLLSVCQTEATGAACTLLQTKKSVCILKLDNAAVAVATATQTGTIGDIANAGILTADALLCTKNFYDSAKAAFDALPPVNPTCPYGGTYPNCNPVPPIGGSTTSPLVYILGAVVGLGVVGGGIYLLAKKK